MGKKKKRLPGYVTVIGEGTEVAGGLRFWGGLHIDGRVTGDVCGLSEDGCALTLGRSGVIQGNLDVAHVVLDGKVIGDVRAADRAILASGARIEGTLHYGVLEMAEGAEVNGKVLRIGELQGGEHGRPVSESDKQVGASVD
jgi:cytoskeletal protein CcmA (bactofilin family)